MKTLVTLRVEGYYSYYGGTGEDSKIHQTQSESVRITYSLLLWGSGELFVTYQPKPIGDANLTKHF